MNERNIINNGIVCGLELSETTEAAVEHNERWQ